MPRELRAQDELETSMLHVLLVHSLPIGRIVVPFGGSYLEFYKVIPKRNYFGAHG